MPINEITGSTGGISSGLPHSGITRAETQRHCTPGSVSMSCVMQAKAESLIVEIDASDIDDRTGTIRGYPFDEFE